MYTTINTLIFLSVVFFSHLALALEAGQLLPGVNAQLEELTLNDDEVQVNNTHSGELKGKVYTVYHLAPSMGIDELHKPYFDAVNALNLDSEQHQIITIANLDEAAWGTSGLARSRLSANTRKYPDKRFLLDNNSSVKNAWKLKGKSAVIILVDEEGKIIAVKEGQVAPDEVEALLAYITERL